MATVISTVHTAAGNAMTYSFTFPYLQADDVKVEIDGVGETNIVVSNNTITWSSGLYIPTNGSEIVIYRSTAVTTPAVTWTGKTYLDPENLDLQARQSLYALQELDDTYVTDSLDSRVTILEDEGHASKTYVDAADATLQSSIDEKALLTYVDSQNAAQDIEIVKKATQIGVDAKNNSQDAAIDAKPTTTYVNNGDSATLASARAYAEFYVPLKKAYAPVSGGYRVIGSDKNSDGTLDLSPLLNDRIDSQSIAYIATDVGFSGLVPTDGNGGSSIGQVIHIRAHVTPCVMVHSDQTTTGLIGARFNLEGDVDFEMKLGDTLAIQSQTGGNGWREISRTYASPTISNKASDVDTTGVTDGQVLTYNSSASEWQAADSAGGGSLIPPYISQYNISIGYNGPAEGPMNAGGGVTDTNIPGGAYSPLNSQIHFSVTSGAQNTAWWLIPHATYPRIGFSRSGLWEISGTYGLAEFSAEQKEIQMKWYKGNPTTAIGTSGSTGCLADNYWTSEQSAVLFPGPPGGSNAVVGARGRPNPYPAQFYIDHTDPNQNFIQLYQGSNTVLGGTCTVDWEALWGFNTTLTWLGE